MRYNLSNLSTKCIIYKHRKELQPPLPCSPPDSKSSGACGQGGEEVCYMDMPPTPPHPPKKERKFKQKIINGLQ